MGFKSDIEIAREAKLEEIHQIAAKLNIGSEYVEPYGKYKAKVPVELIDEDKIRNHNLILVTAITPTKAGIGKTTTSIGLALGLNKIGKQVSVALREPSLGPCFGMKGGAAGGGYAQVLPMEDINLHFTGDFHAITTAHNMITALLDNYIYQNRGTDKALKDVVWHRVLDINDRNLRGLVTGLGGTTDGVVRESSFDITPASEIMAILCLAKNIEDLRHRIENIILGYKADETPFTVKNLGVAGSIVVLLKNAINPNLVQTIENTPAFIHGGPFANIAHGCNSIIATKTALTHSQYVITEAGFGADLGAEKFFNIKCRIAGLQPKLSVLVATTQALKMHGGVALTDIKKENIEGLTKGFENLDKHICNMQSFGQTVIVAVNKYGFDTQQELDLIKEHCESMGVGFALNESFLKGGEGAIELAHLVVDTINTKPSQPLKFSYALTDDIETKIDKVSRHIYGANAVEYSAKAKMKIELMNKLGMVDYPVCIAKTQYSFSEDATAYGVSKNFKLTIRDIVINAGAGFIVAVAGSIMRMPGLPKVPQANSIDIIDGNIVGLS